MITERKIEHWNDKGWVAFDSLLDGKRQERLSQWVGEVACEAEAQDHRLHYYEATDRGPQICRTERFLEDHEALAGMITGPELMEIADGLLGEPAILFKEKINYKQPGGAGFSAHQDAVAYAQGRQHVTCLIAVDPMTPKNGCLEFASGQYDSLLKTNATGCIAGDVEAQLTWEAVALPAGGAVFFSSLVPHRSAANNSGWPRRALYLTYNASAEGDLRRAYYAARAKTMERAAEVERGRNAQRISTVGHFQGRSVEARQ